MNKVYLGILTVMAMASLCTGQTAKDEHTGKLKLASGTRITAELQKSIDANRAKVGDEVVLKMTQSIRQNGEVVVPKGSHLIGRVTEVSRWTKDNTGSRIGLVFDRIRGKQLSIPLNSTIVSVTNAAVMAQLDDIAMADTSGSSSTTTRRSGSGGSGLLGGVANTTTQVVGGVTNTVTRTADTTAGTIGRTVNGMRISTAASGSANSSTTLSTPNKNLRVEKGATFDLRVAH